MHTLPPRLRTYHAPAPSGETYGGSLACKATGVNAMPRPGRPSATAGYLAEHSTLTSPTTARSCRKRYRPTSRRLVQDAMALCDADHCRVTLLAADGTAAPSCARSVDMPPYIRPIAFSTASTFAAPGSRIGVSGRRNTFSIRPMRDRAYFTGRGLLSTNNTLKSGSNW